ncbi:MAG: hypothetical protein HYV16_08345 [Gammaproteobacteria bacterium]|nr:hypothetical protein [Gammaproteobacteria bacterium]
MLLTFKSHWRWPVVLAVTLLLTLQGCSRPEETLRQRAMEWGELLSRLDVLSRKDAIEKIVDYLEPSAGREARAAEYYRMWTKEREAPTVAFSVDEVLLNKQQKAGTVRYTSVLRLEDGARKTTSQETHWRRVDGQWYRVIVAAKIQVND